jgi:hypothetical protein
VHPDPKIKLPVTQLSDPGANVESVEELSRQLYSTGNPELAKRLAFEAGQLEAFYATIRSSAEEVSNSAQALAVLRTMIPPPAPPPAVAPSQEESARTASLASRAAAEEGFRGILGLDLNKPAPPTEDTGAPENPNEFDLDQFFANVSRSVIDAQRELDVASMQYSRELANSPVPPAFYSIPTVHAEIKAGLSSTDGNGILVKLISDQTQSTFTESTISFDIVSSSPPPGALGKFTAAIPRFLAVEGPDWQHVIDALSAVPPALQEGWRERTIIVRDLDPQLTRLGKSVTLAFVFGPVASPTEGSPTDYSGVSLTVYKFNDAGGATPVPAAEINVELVRALSSAAYWLASNTVR